MSSLPLLLSEAVRLTFGRRRERWGNKHVTRCSCLWHKAMSRRTGGTEPDIRGTAMLPRDL